MNVTTISQFRKETKKYLDQVFDDQDILIVARSKGRSVVLMPLETYNAMFKSVGIKAPKIQKKLTRRLHDSQ